MENKKMNKKEFARKLAQKTGLTIKDIEEVVLPAIKDVMVELADDQRSLVINGVCSAKPHYKKGNRLYFLKSEIDEWLKNHGCKAIFNRMEKE